MPTPTLVEERERIAAEAERRIEALRKAPPAELKPYGIGRDYSKFNQSGHCMTGYDFTDATLRWTKFNGADLSGSLFDRTNLSFALLRNADLRGAKFFHANLHRASFRGADLRGAQFYFCHGQMVDFDDAVIDETTEFIRVKFKGTLRRGVDFSIARYDDIDCNYQWVRGLVFEALDRVVIAVEWVIGLILFALLFYGLMMLPRFLIWLTGGP